MSRGVVAAGHLLTAEAGASALRAGGNAVDAAVGAVLASLVCESPLTGLGAGGYMLVHEPGGENVLLDFFVAAPGLGDARRQAELDVVPVHFNDEVSQDFYIGPASCGVPGVPRGLCHAIERFGSLPMTELAKPAVEAARNGVDVTEQQGYIHHILTPILTREPEGAAIYAPGEKVVGPGGVLRLPAVADDIERLAEDGAGPFYSGEVAETMARHVTGAGGELSLDDLGSYEVIEREPVCGSFCGAAVLTNPPPSSGGILICLALDILDRLGRTDADALVGASQHVQALRTDEYYEGLEDGEFARAFLNEDRVARAAEEVAARIGPADAPPSRVDRMGSTTHITAVDAGGMCAAVTCSNGSGSGIFVPGTGIHLNNMLGEQDLSPLGFHATPAGRRMPSMMSPTVITRDGALIAGLGSGGSNRIRSAVTQTIIRVLAGGDAIDEAVEAPRLHFEDGVVEAEPGLDPGELAAVEARGVPVHRWQTRNLFFGGVHAVARNPASGELQGAGDPRRGGAVAVA